MKVFELPAFGMDAWRMVERPVPLPKAGEVLVRMRAASLNYRDLLVTQGLYNPRMRLPAVPLSDGAGEVVEVGPECDRFRAGDRVIPSFMQTWLDGPLTEAKSKGALGGGIDGVLAEYVVFQQDGLLPIPEYLSFEEAATLPCAAVTAWNALIVEGKLAPGDTVLTIGTGGVSLFALRIARLAGARVLITSSSNEKLARARLLGAAEGINYKQTPEWDRRARELTGGTGVDHVVELGGAGTLPLSLRAVRHAGRVSLIGVLTGPAGEANPLPALMKAVCIQGIYVGSKAMFADMLRAFELHQVHPVIDRTFPFRDAPLALRHMAGASHFGKIVVQFE